ncbi:hypothetical protein DXG01_016281 [Tephrocybe rancida]|nr:hypothetical protein DXG01_016281 [Tephrocybe rancida]
MTNHRNSLRIKHSLPNLNLRHNTSRHDESISPMSPTVEADLLQVKDMGFKLVRPKFGHMQGTRSSEDSGVMGPALSFNGPWSPAAVLDGSSSVWQPLKSSASMVDAHRQRELKWMTVLGSVQLAQSRKSKVKKLIFDGALVREVSGVVNVDGWEGEVCVPGAYAQLGGKGRIAALADVERDVRRCFADQPQLQSKQGPVLSLLQAYLTMSSVKTTTQPTHR